MRLLYNNAIGALGAGLTAGGTTIQFAVAPSFPTITNAGDLIPLALEPTVGSSPSAGFEIVYLTAYTAGQTTGTILRGQDGTTGVSHSLGAIWTCAPLAADVSDTSSVTAYISPSGGDDGAVISAALANFAPFASPNVVLVGKNYNLTTKILFPKGTARLSGVKGRGTTITCSGTAQQAINVVATNPGDVIGPHYLDDLTVDHANSGSSVGALYSLVRADFSHVGLYVSRCNTINVSNSAGSIMVLCSAPTAHRNLLNMVFEDVNFSGGFIGMQVQGSGGVTGTGVDVLVAHVRINRWFHDTTVPPVSVPNGTVGANIQLGSTGYCDDVVIGPGEGRNSPDVGIEIDSPYNAIIDSGVTIVNPWNSGVKYTKFRELGIDEFGNTLTPEMAKITINDFTVEQTINLNGIPKIQLMQTAGGPAINSIKIDGYTYKRSAPGGIANVASGEALGIGTTTTPATINGDITLRNLRHIIQGFTGDNAGAATWTMAGVFLATAPTVMPVVYMTDVVSQVRGSQGVGALGIRHFQFEGAMILDRQGPVTYDHQVAGQTGNTSLAVYGANGATLGPGTRLMGAKVRNGFVGNATPRGDDIQGTGTLTITDEILVEGNDYSNLVGGSGTEIRFNAAQNRNKVRLKSNKYVAVNAVNYKIAAAASTNNFTTAAFVSGTWNQYIGGEDANIVFANATGAAITAIDVSPDGGTTIVPAWTQASGAMSQTVRIHVRNGWSLRVTFATTQPTTTVEFVS